MARYDAGIYEVDVYGEIVGAGGDIIVDFELWRATIDNQLIEDISDQLVGGSASLNHDRAIKTEATFTVKDAARVSPYVDYLAVFINREYGDGSGSDRDQLGLYTTKVPPGTRTVERAEGVYTGNDLTAVLAGYGFTDTYNLTAGTNYVTAVLTIAALTGVTRLSIPATTLTLATDKSFRVGTTALEACNELLTAIGYYNLAMDLDGTLVSGPTRSVEYVEPFRTVTPADLMAPVTTQPTDTTVANVVIVVKDNFDAAPLTAIRRNDATDSPTSTVNLGVRTRVERRAELVDQDAVDALADRLLSEGRTFYQTARTTLLPDPRFLIPHQTVELAGTGKLTVLDGRWWVRTAQIGFTPATSGPVVELNRVTDRIEGTVI
jgi:hypothetical protein